MTSTSRRWRHVPRHRRHAPRSKEILKSYTAKKDDIYGDPAVCAPPVIQHVDDGTRNIHGHCGRDYRDQVLCGVTLSKP